MAETKPTNVFDAHRLRKVDALKALKTDKADIEKTKAHDEAEAEKEAAAVAKAQDAAKAKAEKERAEIEKLEKEVK